MSPDFDLFEAGQRMAREEGGTDDRGALTVTQLLNRIKDTLEGEIGDVWVEGEISQFKTYPSGHSYFRLKDAGAEISSVLFRGSRQRVKFEPEHGLKVLARGRVSAYPQRGQLQLIVNAMEPRDMGSLHLRFEQLKKKLAADGLFDDERKRTIPPYPQTIGIITSPVGAAIRDMLSVLKRRGAGLRILIRPSAVQGEKAAPEIAQAIAEFNELCPETDVLLVGRGGGSLEDLWAFNEEVVARAIAGSKIPVISCVGHETDTTIADYVADLRAPTPSAAAELVVRNKEELLETLGHLQVRLVRALEGHSRSYAHRVQAALGSYVFQNPGRILEPFKRRLEQALKSRVFQQPERMFEDRARRVDDATEALFKTLGLKLERAQERFKLQAAKLHALSPLAVLGRGYAIARRPDGAALRDAKDAKKGDKLSLKLAKGELPVEVV